jgi:hypothetical protein
MIMREGQLEFDFSGAVAATRMDGPDSPMPQRMRKVDFLVEEEGRLLLVEVKDPWNPATPLTARQDFLRRMRSGNLVNDSLVPKCRDTYTFLHLMHNEVLKPRIYIVVLGRYERRAKLELFGPLTVELRRRLKKENGAKRSWVRHYVNDCFVVSVEGWNKVFPSYPVSRCSIDAD